MDLYFDFYAFAEPFTYSGKLDLIGLKSMPMGIEGSLLRDFIALLFVLMITIWPPYPLIRCGTVFVEFTGYGLCEIEPRILMNRFCLWLIFGIFFLYESLLGRSSEFLTNLIGRPLIAVAIGLLSNLAYFLWIKGETKFDGVLIQEEIDPINDYVIHENIGFFDDNRIILINGRFWYSIERVADLKFKVFGSRWNIWVPDNFSIVAENPKSGRRYTFRMISTAMMKYLGNAIVETACPIIYGQFIERFTSYIIDNPTFAWRNITSLDLCIGCSSKRPEVVIRKTCIGDSICSSCDCRPTHCAACIARLFAEAQPVTHLSQWMDGTAQCPTCSAAFCANDVLFIVNEIDL